MGMLRTMLTSRDWSALLFVLRNVYWPLRFRDEACFWPHMARLFIVESPMHSSSSYAIEARPIVKFDFWELGLNRFSELVLVDSSDKEGLPASGLSRGIVDFIIAADP